MAAPITFGLPLKLRQGYAEFYADNRASHELTISLGVHPRKFEPEVEFIPQMRRITREMSQRLRNVPKRKLLRLQHQDAVWMAGFYEHTDASGMIFPHWHGVVALLHGEEGILRSLLVECLGRDETDRGSAFATRTTRPLIKIQGAKPTFHLTQLATPERFVSYAAKKAQDANSTHWTTADFL